jgi:hypothetical protein
MQFDIGEETFGVLGVIGENVGAELHFALRLADALPHLQRHGAREFVEPVVHELRRLGDDHGAFGVRLASPGFVTLRGGRDLDLELLVGDLVEALKKVSVEGIHALVRHGFVLFRWCGGDAEILPRVVAFIAGISVAPARARTPGDGVAGADAFHLT